MIADEKLVEAAKLGSDTAFSDLVARYQQRLLRFLLTRCASRADAEDVLQDTFMNAYRYLDSYNPRWQFSTWLYRIAIHNVTHPARDTAAIDSDQAGLASDEPGPLEACIKFSDRENLWLTAQRLISAEAYSAMWLRYVEDMTVRDVARVMEKPISWTKVTLMRSRRRLQKEISTAPAAQPQSELSG